VRKIAKNSAQLTEEELDMIDRIILITGPLAIVAQQKAQRVRLKI